MKLGTRDLYIMRHKLYFMTKVISARAARGNRRQRCKNGQKCARSAHFCSDLNETWYKWSLGHGAHLIFYDKSGFRARSARKSASKVQKKTKMRAERAFS